MLKMAGFVASWQRVRNTDQLASKTETGAADINDVANGKRVHTAYSSAVISVVTPD